MRIGTFEGYLLLHPLNPRYYILHQIPGAQFAYRTSWGDLITPTHAMKTDLGSIPKWIWWIPGFDRDHYSRSYCIHDYNYWTRRYPRWYADWLLLECLFSEIDENMREWNKWARPFIRAISMTQALVIVLNVRCFGWAAWLRKGSRRDSKKNICLTENKC
jgi:hypothetical protein